MDAIENDSSLDFDPIDDVSSAHYLGNHRFGTNNLRRITSEIPHFNGTLNNHYSLSHMADILEPEYHQLGIRIHHLNTRVRDLIVTNPNGCCIYFGRFDEVILNYFN